MGGTGCKVKRGSLPLLSGLLVSPLQKAEAWGFEGNLFYLTLIGLKVLQYKEWGELVLRDGEPGCLASPRFRQALALVSGKSKKMLLCSISCKILVLSRNCLG